MFTLDFGRSGRKAFTGGFLRGLAAPAMLYRSPEFPPLPKFEPVTAPSYPIEQALAGDWARIGADMRKVIEQHGKATAPAHG